MKTIATKIFIAIFVMCLTSAPAAYAKSDDFNSVVKMIEDFYRVKHVGIPFLAKAGMKVATTAARIKGGTARRLAEAGSIKLAVFENQDFNGDFQKFRSSLNQALNVTWMPLIQTLSAAGGEQTYIFLRDAGDKTILHEKKHRRGDVRRLPLAAHQRRTDRLLAFGLGHVRGK